MSKASLAWLLQQENVPGAITGASTREQVVQNIDIPALSQVFNCMKYPEYINVIFTTIKTTERVLQCCEHVRQITVVKENWTK